MFKDDIEYLDYIQNFEIEEPQTNFDMAHQM